MAMTSWRYVLAMAMGLTASVQAQPELGVQIPAALGDIIRVSAGVSSVVPDYILIQDVHSHGEVQLHIASLLALAQKEWQVKQVFIEGAFSNVHVQDLPASFLENEAWKVLTENGQLSGPELSLLQNPSLKLVGIDDPALYRQDILAYEWLKRWREKLAYSETPLTDRQRDLLKHLLSLQMTPEDYAQYKSGKVPGFVSPSWQQAIRYAENFYDVADRRSQTFIDRAEQLGTAGPWVLVAGGFHTAAMCNHLMQLGKSFVVIRPRITRAGYTRQYESNLAETTRLLEAPALIASAR